MSTNAEIAPLLNVEGNKPRSSKPSAPVPTSEVEKPKEDVSEALAEDVLRSKPETYADRLKAHNLTTPMAREIMEKILVQGYYEETFQLGSIPIKLRTRTYADSVRTQNFLEKESPTYNLAINEVIARYNLAASLGQYGDKIFDFPEGDVAAASDAFEARYSFVMTKPYVVISKILGFLYQFDRKVAAVFSEGAPEDF